MPTAVSRRRQSGVRGCNQARPRGRDGQDVPRDTARRHAEPGPSSFDAARAGLRGGARRAGVLLNAMTGTSVSRTRPCSTHVPEQARGGEGRDAFRACVDAAGAATCSSRCSARERGRDKAAGEVREGADGRVFGALILSIDDAKVSPVDEGRRALAAGALAAETKQAATASAPGCAAHDRAARARRPAQDGRVRERRAAARASRSCPACSGTHQPLGEPITSFSSALVSAALAHGHRLLHRQRSGGAVHLCARYRRQPTADIGAATFPFIKP